MASNTINLNTYRAKLLSNTYGANNEPIYFNAGVPTILGTIGADNKPVWVDNGVISTLTTIGANNKPVWVNDGVISTLTTIGGTTKPVWVNNGVITEMTAGTTAQFYRGDKTWSNALTGDISIGSRGVTSGPSSITYSNRITIVPYFHTGGPWYIKSGDDASNAWLSVYYGSTQILRMKHDGTQALDWKGNASTATALTSNAGGTEQPIYFTGGKPAATSYALKATVNNGTAGRLSYYSGDRAISSTTNIHALNNYLISNSRNGASVDIRANGLIIWGQTYGNTANQMLSNTAGVFRFGDGGPQIVFNTSNSWNAQAGALVFTDHDTAGTGTSFHFVSTESNDNNGGNCTVTAPRFRARRGITIGQNSDNTSYNLYVNGTSYFNGNTTHNGIDYFANGTTYYINNSAVAYFNDLRTDNVRLVDNWIGFYQNANAGGNRYGYIQANVDRMYFRKENGVSTYHFDFNGHLYSTGGFYSTASPGLNITTAAGSWAFLRLHNSSNFFDIATISNQNSGCLDIRPGGSANIGPRVYTSGMATFASVSSSDANYSGASLQIREQGYGGAGTDSWARAPRLAWHWSGRVAAQIGLASNGYLYTAPSTKATFYKLVYESGSWGISVTGSSASCTGNAATATRINGNLTAATSDVNRNIWVSSTASADGIPNYISYFNMNPSTKVFTVPSGTRISPNAGALYLGNSGNQSWVYVQDMASQASGTPWKLTQAGVLTCVTVNANLTGNVTGNCSGSSGSCTGNAATATKLGTANKGSATQPIYLSGGTPTACTMTASGAYKSAIPFLDGSGVMEIGPYIDFHATTTITSDYSIRLIGGVNSLTVQGTNPRTICYEYVGTTHGRLLSSNGVCIQVQQDKNCVLYDAASNVLWATWTASSKRIKDNIQSITNDELNNFEKLNVVSFTYKPEMKMADTSKQYGLIAEELIELYPNLVTIPENYKDEEFDVKKGWEQPLISVKYEGFIPLLIKMVQNQQKEIEELKKIIQKQI